jgi:5-(carboxyamino)imidazole ribonucleotide synthase
VETPKDVESFAARWDWPVVAKAARGGYDGRGVWVLHDRAAAAALFQETTQRGLELIVEQWVPIEREVAAMVARRPNGQAVAYPVVETVQRNGICHELVAPAPIPADLAAAAQQLALQIANAAGVVGILAVELFVSEGQLVINEIAVRPHNSGHYTIEGCVTSQFENHLRAVLDWPLGETALIAPAVATANILGTSHDDPHHRLPAALAIPGVHVHLYDKPARPGRKLGHVTATGDDPATVRARATHAAAILAGAKRGSEGEVSPSPSGRGPG